MARRLALLLLVVPLAMPAAAEARSQSVKVRMPAEGDMSFARYIVTTSNPDDLTVRGARRLGSSMILTSARPLGRRRYEVTALLVNPGTDGGAAQRGAFELVFQSFELAKGAITLFGIVHNFLNEPLTGSEPEALGQFCDRPPPTSPRRIRRRGRRFFESRGGTADGRRRIRRLFTPAACPDTSPAATAAATRELRERGIDVPGCVGSVGSHQGSPNEVSARMVCTKATNVFSLRAPAGNEGRNCMTPQGSACAYGPFCQPMPRESTCYADSDGFAQDTLLEFRAQFAQPVAPRDVRGFWIPQGSQVVTDEHAYLRPILDTP